MEADLFRLGFTPEKAREMCTMPLEERLRKSKSSFDGYQAYKAEQARIEREDRERRMREAEMRRLDEFEKKHGRKAREKEEKRIEAEKAEEARLFEIEKKGGHKARAREERKVRFRKAAKGEKLREGDWWVFLEECKEWDRWSATLGTEAKEYEWLVKRTLLWEEMKKKARMAVVQGRKWATPFLVGCCLSAVATYAYGQ